MWSCRYTDPVSFCSFEPKQAASPPQATSAVAVLAEESPGTPAPAAVGGGTADAAPAQPPTLQKRVRGNTGFWSCVVVVPPSLFRVVPVLSGLEVLLLFSVLALEACCCYRHGFAPRLPLVPWLLLRAWRDCLSHETEVVFPNTRTRPVPLNGLRTFETRMSTCYPAVAAVGGRLVATRTPKIREKTRNIS